MNAQEIIERIMTAHLDVRWCECWICVAGRGLDFRCVQAYLPAKLGNRAKYPVPPLDYHPEVERLRAIVDRLPKDGEGNVYPPPQALSGRVFYHPAHLGPAPRLFSQLCWHPAEYWAIGCGGHEVALSECYLTLEAAKPKKGE